jgi:hypothetical protein
MAGRLKRGAAWSPPLPHHTYTLSKISGLLVTVTHLHTVKDLRCVGYCYPHQHTVKDLRFGWYCYLTYTLSKISGVLVSVTSPTHCQRSPVCWLLLPSPPHCQRSQVFWLLSPHLHTVKDIRCVGYCYLTYTLSKISGLLVYVTLTCTLSKISGVLVTVISPTHCQRSQVCWFLLPHLHTVKDFRFVGYCHLTYTLSKISGLLVTVISPTVPRRLFRTALQ